MGLECTTSTNHMHIRCRCATKAMRCMHLSLKQVKVRPCMKLQVSPPSTSAPAGEEETEKADPDALVTASLLQTLDLAFR